MRFWELAYPADALPPTEEAVATRRELAASPDRYRADLAQALINLGNWLANKVARTMQRRSWKSRSVGLMRELAAHFPDRYGADLATSLANLTVRFGDLGRQADALSLTEEAVAIRRELAAASPERYRAELAKALSNLGVWLSGLGRPGDAVPVLEESVTIRRDLAAAFPDRVPRRACDAVPVAEGAVKDSEGTGGRVPGPLSRRTRRSLNNLGSALSELRRWQEALTVEQEAVTIAREFTAAFPDRYRANLGELLSHIAVILTELDWRPLLAKPARPSPRSPVSDDNRGGVRIEAGERPGSREIRISWDALAPPHILLR